MYRFIVGFLLFSTMVFADELNLTYGIDPGRARDSKFASLSYFAPYSFPLPTKSEIGLFTDRNNSSSAFIFQSAGIRVVANPLLLESYWGFGFISTPDSVLSTRFQFTNDINLGILDKSGDSIGVSYKHISNAGIKNPNLGRDFIMVYWKYKVF